MGSRIKSIELDLGVCMYCISTLSLTELKSLIELVNTSLNKT